MKKVLSLLFVLLLFPFNHLVYANEVKTTSDIVLLYNLNDDEIIYELNSEKEVNIASLTKMMTALVAIENCENLDEKVTIESQYFEGLEEYSMAGFSVGEKVSIKDLLYGVLLPSGAEACNAIAYHIGKDMNGFVQLMNQKAKELNLNHTQFDNPIGIDSDSNYSSAKDLSILLKYALNNPTFKEIFTTKKHYIASSDITLETTLIGYSRSYGINTSTILGSKTGYTSGAGYCLASIATFDNIDYLLIVLNADTDKRYNAVLDSLKVYEYYSKNYGYHTVVPKSEIIHNLPIKWGMEKEYSITTKEDIVEYIQNDFEQSKIKLNYNGVEELNYKIKKGDLLGTVTVSYEDKVLGNFDVYLDEDFIYVDPYLLLILLVLLLIVVSLYAIRFYNIRKKRLRRRQLKRQQQLRRR